MLGPRGKHGIHGSTHRNPRKEFNFQPEEKMRVPEGRKFSQEKGYGGAGCRAFIRRGMRLCFNGLVFPVAHP